MSFIVISTGDYSLYPGTPLRFVARYRKPSVPTIEKIIRSMLDIQETEPVPPYTCE